VRDNALKGRTFRTLVEENRHLVDWEHQVADHRIHGTTRDQVRQVFEQVERRTLVPLPQDLFPFFHEAQRIVHRDGHIEVERAYYSVLPEYLGHTAWVRWDSRLVRVFNQRFEQIALHVKREEGRFSTDPHRLGEDLDCRARRHMAPQAGQPHRTPHRPVGRRHARRTGHAGGPRPSRAAQPGFGVLSAPFCQGSLHFAALSLPFHQFSSAA